MAPVYSSAFAPPTASEIGAMGAMVPAYFSMTRQNLGSVGLVGLQFGLGLVSGLDLGLVSTSSDAKL